ncbi:MAG: hypothetical protein KKB37_10315, partial [Alphaproteobacteria bacterium]|nr:hypothetical protein [Alphaproteobacteria bacterium]
MLRTSVSASPSLISLVNELRVARWFWCAIVVGIVGGRYFFGGETPLLGPKFGDTDDALRLLQVRDFLVHGNWFDTHLSAIGAPQPLNSHWSRLIDLPLAWLVSFFALLLPYLTAETAAAIVWPLLLLYALARFMTAEAERRAGAYAGAVVLVLLVLCTTAVFQFMPGRIDHHNAQILFATLGLLLLQRAVTDARSGWYAGAAIAA